MSRDVKILDRQQLPCGCTIGRAMVDEVRTIFIDPCSMKCEYYKFTIEESLTQGVPIEKRTTL